MENKLISMVDFVLVNNKGQNCCEYGAKVIKYANFLNTPLDIGMFVPAIKVGDKWEVLENPKVLLDESLKYETAFNNIKQYQKAKEQVLFDGFDVNVADWCDELVFELNNINIGLCFNYEYENQIIINAETERDIKTIEDLIEYKPTLTEQGMIKSGLK